MSDYPAPPNYRLRCAHHRNGIYGINHRLDRTGVGAHRPNASVPPLVYTNGVGERVILVERSVSTRQPLNVQEG